MRIAITCLILGGCAFHPATDQQPPGDDSPGVDASAPEIDAPVPPSGPVPLYAASNQMLHRIDLDHQMATPIGPIQAPGGDTIDVAGLAFDGTSLLGLTPMGGSLIRIDPATGAMLSKKNLLPVARWGGLTVVPAGDLEAVPVVFTGSNDDGQLFRINAINGSVTAVGEFGQNLSFFSDLAWVHGQGLFATLYGGTCNPVCFAKIDPATGEATILRTTVPNTIFGLSGYRDQLWAFNGNGPVLSVSMTSWLMTIAFDPAIHWTEAAQ